MIAPRRIAYVTGTRADFGLMGSTLQLIRASDALDLSIVVTGMHLSPAYGMTVRDIEAAGLPISARIEVEDGAPSGALMARNIGRMLAGLVDAFERLKPDIVLLLGDRGEMLAAAVAAIHLNVPVAHIHGGERSGTVDEPIRHAISKLSHFHLVATEESRERLMRMGETAERVFVVGAPGLDGIVGSASVGKGSLFEKYGLDAARPLALFLYHPVLQEAGSGEAGSAMILDAIAGKGLQILGLKPNSDAGSAGIRADLEARASRGEISLVTHLPRTEYLSFLRIADVLIGNSSSGIIEAATFGTPVINVGSRQNLRQRNANVVDVAPTREAIGQALLAVLQAPRGSGANVYGDGQAGARIVSCLATLPLDDELMRKTNAY